MKWIWILILTVSLGAAAQARERLAFPFDQVNRITFIRLGNITADAGQQFVLRYDEGQWVIERRISRTQATSEDISEERAQEILKAFSELYTYWNSSPYRDSKRNGYSLFISTSDTWQTAMRVKDRGSPQLNELIDLIEYPDGLVLNEVKKDETEPGVIRASTEEETETGDLETDESAE